MTEAPNAVLFFRKQAIFTEKMAASLIREADAGALELLGVSAASPADVPELPRKLPFLPQDRLAAAEPRWVFLFSGADKNAGSVHRRADRIKQLLPAPVLRLGRKADQADSILIMGITNDKLQFLSDNHVPIFGHVGALSGWQTGNIGGYKRIAKTADEAFKVYRTAYEYQECGMKGMTIELVPAEVAQTIAQIGEMYQKTAAAIKQYTEG